MKKSALYIFFLVVFTLNGLAQTADQIVSDYRARTEKICERLNSTLRTESTKIAAKLTAAGDLDGAAQISKQLELKMIPSQVDLPHPGVKILFDQYDIARKTALTPFKQEALQKLDKLLQRNEGRNLDGIVKVSEAKTEIQNDIPSKEEALDSTVGYLTKYPLPLVWKYYVSANYDKVYGTLTLYEDGRFDLNAAAPVNGTWKPSQNPKVLDFTIFPAGGQGEEKTTMLIINETEATMHRYSGQRYLKAERP